MWEELPNSKMSRVKTELTGVSIFNRDDWNNINLFFTDKMPRFESAFRPVVEELRKI